jgi:hypothetical protein
LRKWLLSLLLVLALCIPAIAVAEPTKEDLADLTEEIYNQGEDVNVWPNVQTKAVKIVEMVGDHRSMKHWALIFYREDNEGNVYVGSILFHDEEWIESDRYHVNQTSVSGGLDENDEVACTAIRKTWIELTLGGQSLEMGPSIEVSKEEAKKLLYNDIEFWIGKLFNKGVTI